MRQLVWGFLLFQTTRLIIEDISLFAFDLIMLTSHFVQKILRRRSLLFPEIIFRYIEVHIAPL